MQVFSGLQRNSVNNLLKIVAVLALGVFNSEYIFFPLFLGFVWICAEFWVAVLYIVVFSLFHSINGVWLLGLYLILFFYLQERIKHYIHSDYREVVYIFLIYLLLYVLMPKVNYLLIYLTYNYVIDLIAVRLCVQKSSLE
ncbi:MAG: hypothetical protein GXO62_01250 [Epsilonproteobacteria bacterium]|nr:hypothetical protein [Campylobacterota bacterium]